MYGPVRLPHASQVSRPSKLTSSYPRPISQDSSSSESFSSYKQADYETDMTSSGREDIRNAASPRHYKPEEPLSVISRAMSPRFETQIPSTPSTPHGVGFSQTI